MRKRATALTRAGASPAAWGYVAALLATLGGAVWVVAAYFKPAWSSVSQEILFLCLLALILYELTKAGRAGRGE
jgi:hypothetical protein